MFAYVSIVGSRRREKVPLNLIKRFNIEKHVPTQKYKLWNGENSTEECIVFFVAETEKELDALINGQRTRPPPVKCLQSSAETTEDESPTSRKRKAVPVGNVPVALKKRLSALRGARAAESENSENNLDAADADRRKSPISIRDSHDKENFSPTVSPKGQAGISNPICKNCQSMECIVKTQKQKIKSLRDQVESLEKQASVIKEELVNMKAVVQVLEDDNERKEEALQKLRKLNEDWQQLSIQKYSQLIDIHRATVEAPSTSEGQFPAVGFITEDGSQIHIGRGLYLSTQAWYLALNVPFTRKITFARNILVSLCGYDYLSRTTVSGKGSNRNRQENKPEYKLDDKLLLAIRDIYSYYLVTERNYSKDAADVEAGRVHVHIAKKISDIKRAKKKAYAPVPEKAVMGDKGSGENENPQGEEGEIEVDMGNGERVALSELETSEFLEAAIDSGDEVEENIGTEVRSDPLAMDSRDEDIRRLLNGENEADLLDSSNENETEEFGGNVESEGEL